MRSAAWLPTSCALLLSLSCLVSVLQTPSEMSANAAGYAALSKGLKSLTKTQEASRRPSLFIRYRTNGMRLPADPMLWSHVAVKDWVLQDLELPWCSALFAALEIDGPKLLQILGLDHLPLQSLSKADESSGTSLMNEFLERHDGTSVQFDHGMGLHDTQLPRRTDFGGARGLRFSVSEAGAKLAASVVDVVNKCVGDDAYICPSSSAYPPFSHELPPSGVGGDGGGGGGVDVGVGVVPATGSSAQDLTQPQDLRTIQPPAQLPVIGPESLMDNSRNSGRFGTCSGPVDQDSLLFGSNPHIATRICCHNRHYAENSGYFKSTSWLSDISSAQSLRGDEADGSVALSVERASGDVGEQQVWNYFDAVTGKRLFSAPIGRSMQEFYEESVAHGWPSFRDQEVDWKNVRSLRNGEMVSIDGTHLGHNIPDRNGNRYCINLVCIAGSPNFKTPPRQLDGASAVPPTDAAALPGGPAPLDVGDFQRRVEGMLWGLFVGNAIGMPTMWFYQPPRQIIEAFGIRGVRGLAPPPAKHSGSIMRDFWRTNREHVREVVGKVILHGREEAWQAPGTHYHSGLKAGDNTINTRLVEELVKTLSKSGDPTCADYAATSDSSAQREGSGVGDASAEGTARPANGEAPDSHEASHRCSVTYDGDAYLQRYIHFMTTPGTHTDTYADTAHVQFFYRYSQGNSPRKCAGVENHSTANIGSTVSLPVLVAAGLSSMFGQLPSAQAPRGTKSQFFSSGAAVAETWVREHIRLTHASPRLLAYAGIMTRLFTRLLAGTAMRDAIDAAGREMGIDFAAIVADAAAEQPRSQLPAAFADLPVVTKAFGLACYIHDSLPTTLYLAYKYHKRSDVRAGLLANANVGGNTADRGAILGAIFGAVRIGCAGTEVHDRGTCFERVNLFASASCCPFTLVLLNPETGSRDRSARKLAVESRPPAGVIAKYQRLCAHRGTSRASCLVNNSNAVLCDLERWASTD